MQAIVKNKFDAHSELLVLNERYLKLQLSERCLVEMRLLTDSTFCMVQTYSAPAPDSQVRIFDKDWNELKVLERPAVEEFLSEDLDVDTRQSLQALSLIKARLDEEDNSITFELQLGELTREQRERAEGKVHEISRSLP